MLGTSTPEYVFICTCIIFLHSIAPFSILYVVLRQASPLLPLPFQVVHLPYYFEVWLWCEAIFYALIYLPYRAYLERDAVHPELLPQAERTELFARCNAHVDDPERYISQWMLGAKKEDIRRENVKEFLRWAFFNAGKAEEKYEEEVEGYVQAIERLSGRELPPGKGKARSLRLTLDRVGCLHRSLLWYMCLAVVDTAAHCILSYHGFRFYRASFAKFFTLFPFRPLTLLSPFKSPSEKLTYWHRPHSSRTRLPVLFLHGIGVGLFHYTAFLRELDLKGKGSEEDSGDVGIIALEIMPVSSRITYPALEKDVMVREVVTIVKKHGWSKFILVGHSYGTIISTHLLKSPLSSPLIGPVVLVDPISFLLHLPDVAYNFTARQPSHANEYLLWYFGSKDIGVAHTLARRFFWTENIMWKEDLGLEGDDGRKVTVAFSGRDIVIDANNVGRYLTAESPRGQRNGTKALETAHGDEQTRRGELVSTKGDEWKRRPWVGSGLEVLWFDYIGHGELFEHEETRGPVIEAIVAYSAAG
ncbi:MAG: hypothetical protein M1819_001216 [Sarea resinae]|nr:MAG: hypothetical protein M1819_001216 [Sarea resinae]